MVVGDVGGTGAGVGAGVGAGAVGVEVSGSPSLVLRVPGEVIMGSSGFQQFFLMYAKLMAGLRDWKVNESGTTPLATHIAMIKAGKPGGFGLGHL